jgi:MFS family permease
MPVKSRLPALRSKPHRPGARHKRAGRPNREPVPAAAWRTLAACTAAAALLQLDGTLITVALPTVSRSLHVSSGSTAIVLSAYFVAYALALLPGGALVDRFDARRLALIGLSVFALGAAAGAVVSSIETLVVTRVVMGVGAGLVSPAALAGAVSGFPPERRGSALGIWGASAGVANLLGPVLGGILTVALGWRANWWALVPLALLAGIGIVRFVPSTVHGEEGANPVLNRTVMVASSIAALTFAIMIGCFYLAEQYLQRSVGYSALGASSVLVVVALLVGVAAPIAGRLADQYGERLPAVAGFLAAGTGLLVLGLPGVPLHSPVTLLPLIPVGLGLGMLFVPTSRAALNATPLSSHGRTSALLSIGRLLGAAVGAGLAGAALAAGVTGSTVHTALLIGAAASLLLGVPAASRLVPRAPVAPLASEG